MRSATKTFVGLAGIGVLVATARLGMPTAVATEATSVASEATSTPTATATPAATPKAKAAAKKTTTVKKTTTTKKTTTVKKTTTSTTSVSKTSAAVSYQFGTVQVKVTKKSGKITNISYVQATATKGRSAVFPDLVAAAISANGSGISNISGATYTTNAFKKAVKSALAKF